MKVQKDNKMVKNGTRPTRQKHTDRDLFKSFGAVIPPSFPDEYLCDSGLTMLDQNADGEPYGCTNYSQADLATDLTGKIHNPADLEAVTHANAKGGYDIRDSLDAARKILKWFTGYYNIRASGILDFFDAFRLAQLSVKDVEKRSITFGTPWFPSWEIACNSIDPSTGKHYFIMPMPTDAELKAIRSSSNTFGWHDSKLDGWTTRNGIVVYRDKSWQGTNIGENGFIAFDRATINTVMSIKGTVGYTGTNLIPTSIQTVDMGLVAFIVSYVRSLLGLQ